MKEERITPEIMEKINKRTEFKINMDMVEMWAAAIKDPEDFRLFIMALTSFCRNMGKPDFSTAKDKRLLTTLFRLEAGKQRNSAICYAKTCIKRGIAGEKGGKERAKRFKANANKSKQNKADIDLDQDLDLGLGSDIDIEDIDIDIEQGSEQPAGPALTGVPPAEEGIVLLPDNFWDEEG